MKILMINKFLHPNGGSETYIFKLGQALVAQGHEVEYFGMEHEGRIVGNRVQSYTTDMDFHGGSKLAKLTYPIKTIYSREARKKLRRVLEDFRPDVCHLNNFNYQLTPSIILEIRSWSKKCKIVYTAHDLQLVCPNHMCHTPTGQDNCEKCLGRHYWNCTRNRCIHGSAAKSLIGTAEATFWRWRGVYKQLDTIICCSDFLRSKLDTDPVLAQKTVTLHNFVDQAAWQPTEKQEYVLYFGRFSQEKGIGMMVQAAKALPHIPFIFAGTGPQEALVTGADNIKNVGFQTGPALEKLIRQAQFSLYPSEWYENCPFAVMESQMYGTPVIGANIGGIPELIGDGVTGELFDSGDTRQLTEKIRSLWEDRQRLARYTENCRRVDFLSVEQYVQKLMAFYC